MSAIGHIEAAIRELERAKNTCESDPRFAVSCLTDARMAIAAAKVEIDSPPAPLAAHIIIPKERVA